jgi:hypothetical protein
LTLVGEKASQKIRPPGEYFNCLPNVNPLLGRLPHAAAFLPAEQLVRPGDIESD